MYQGMIVSIVRKCVRLDMSVVENGNECLLFSPRQGAKALSYCQPRRGGGVKVLLLLSHRESNKEVLPPRGDYGKMGAVRDTDDRKDG